MALFNKLFPGLKITPQNCRENNNVSHKTSSFTTDQVRIVLFRECDFRGRKLLFDSDATQKVQLEKEAQEKKFIEIGSGYGYLLLTKQNSDYDQLSEMIFGSVAMSFRGTYVKIHSLNSPLRLMFTQVFPSPQSRRQKRTSVGSQQSYLSTSTSFEHSIKLDDSGTSSIFSTSERLSDRSTASDTVLVCRRLQRSSLDMPGAGYKNSTKKSLVVDSGCVGQSFSSLSTGPITFPTWESLYPYQGTSLTFSSSAIFKRLFRSSTRSLQYNSVSLPNSTEILNKSHHRGSKLGLSFILEIPAEKEKFLTSFFMDHIALVEALLWRSRQEVEYAYHRPAIFVSLMVDLVQNASSWLVDLFSGPSLPTNLWQYFSGGCDSNYSISAFISDLDSKSAKICRTFRTKSNGAMTEDNNCDNKTRSFSGVPFLSKPDIFSFNISKFLKTDWNACHKKQPNDGDYVVEKFLNDFCELLEKFDVKDTNFFISTLLTAVLTHHLGWVATVYPSTKVEIEAISNFQQPYNALWSQLTDFYGAIGFPVKTAQTILTGNNRNNIISKILNSLTYFIRSGNAERKNVERCCVAEENNNAQIIFSRNNCIPKENYKSYEDHLKEIMFFEATKPCCSNNVAEENKLLQVKGLQKSRTHNNMSELVSEESNDLKECDENQNKLKFNKTSHNFADFIHLESQTDFEKQNLSRDTCDSSVLFLLGDNEKLVGLKKEETVFEERNIMSGVKRKKSVVKRPSSLNLFKSTLEVKKITAEGPNSFKKTYNSSSLESLCIDQSYPNTKSLIDKKSQNIRAQSEPPEPRKTKNQYSRVKFNLQQYPQVVRNYMKSKNIELEGLSLGEKVFDKFATVQHNIKLDLSGYESESEEGEALQTPSNASEMEFTSDMCNETIRENSKEASSEGSAFGTKMMKIVNIPMPKTIVTGNPELPIPYMHTVLKGVVDNYIPDMVLQGTTKPMTSWESKLKNNLAMHSQYSFLDQAVEESLAIVGNTDTWEVQVMSSHTYVIDKSSNGVRVGMSQLVSNMLESLLQMWKLHIPPRNCILHIEQSLREVCLRSKALAQMLLASEFCSIELLTSTLRIEVNDVPLLMAVASTHTPEVTRKYGLSFN